MPLLHRTDQAVTLRIGWRIDVDIDEVWTCLTDAARLPQWLGTPVVHELEQGGRLVVDHGDGYRCTSRITALEPGTHLAMTWQFPDEPATAIAISLVEAGTGCVVELVHSDLGALLGSYTAGWLVHLTYLEAAAAGTPLPTGQFWNLHATTSVLLGIPPES